MHYVLPNLLIIYQPRHLRIFPSQGSNLWSWWDEAQHRHPGLAQLLEEEGGRQHQGVRGHHQECWGRQDGAPGAQGDSEVS